MKGNLMKGCITSCDVDQPYVMVKKTGKKKPKWAEWVKTGLPSCELTVTITGDPGRGYDKLMRGGYVIEIQPSGDDTP